MRIAITGFLRGGLRSGHYEYEKYIGELLPGSKQLKISKLLLNVDKLKNLNPQKKIMAQKTLPNPNHRRVEEGDLLEIDRGAYKHWAVYIGNNEVVHVSGIGGRVASNPGHSFSVSGVHFNKAEVKRENIFDVLGTSKFKINNTKDRKKKCLTPKEVVKRALNKIGPLDYNVLWSNCEHFASWCRNGSAISDQADNILTAGMVFGALVVVGGLLFNATGSDKSSKR